MTYRQFNQRLIASIAVVVVLLCGMNIVVDPFGVLGTSTLPAGPSSNERFLKMQHLLDNPNEYQLLMFGSSRSGMTDPRWIEAHSGLKTYNLSVFSGRPRDMMKLYRGYRKVSDPPIEAFIGLDAMGFLLAPDKADLSRRDHPVIDQVGALSYWLDYLLAPSMVAALEKLNGAREPFISFDWSLGTYRLEGYDREIAKDHKAYIERTFNNWVPREYQSNLDEREWDALVLFLHELEEEGVRVRVFLQPMHEQWQRRMAPLTETLLPRLASIDGIVNLTELGSTDHQDWYEQRHYREPIARSVVERLYGQHEPTIDRVASSRRVE